ncbi:tRNA1(Val) (adenine(37)-N6)-methyltransferase [Periweissella cryptocerci]|uniref:tRNA1(Val) (Adenine(37)-N6)-methyltransferase n=1 Tax=Periweissella cryptocerci TaxID=2506420 RepID=A0A4P6YRQ7_9LACO|nr:tRNA1(Val) (adenine(37)-N6)-methyltransferase [Periweissella cryptocerci]QBO35334.1 tRNA1(Val) (adenine(37)-N6)-methyltransferase [Periweissella cryptocerci]
MAEIKLNADERIDQLYSKDVKIIQSDAVFSFSLDAVLLSEFAKAPKGGHGLTVDLCAGNGAVGLFFAKKAAGTITEVEIQPRLADMAQRSIVLNDLDGRMNVLNIDLADTLEHIKPSAAETVLCNPPYFVDEPQSTKNPNEHLAIARHEIKTNLATITDVASRLLKTNGKVYFVHRPDRFLDLIDELRAHRLAPKRIQMVHSKIDREANMVLVEAIKDGRPGGVRYLEPLIVYNADGSYTKHVHEALYGE